MNQDVITLANIIDQLKLHIDKYCDHARTLEHIVTFVRNPSADKAWYDSEIENDWTTWRVLLDHSKTRQAVRTSQGFRVENRRKKQHIVHGSIQLREMLLSPDIETRILARTILNSKAKKKYGY